MLKQGVKRINAEFILTHALSHLFFLQFRLYAALFLGLLLSLILMLKSKKTLYYLENQLPNWKTVHRFCSLFNLKLSFDLC